MGVFTILIVIYLMISLEYGIRYQGVKYTFMMCLINFILGSCIWTYWIIIRRNTTYFKSMTLALLFHCWIFWYGFPYLGELP